MTILGRLDRYYRKKKIHSQHFDCPHWSCCSLAVGSPGTATQAKSSYVGPEYEHACPRLLFLSLDSGDLGTSPEERTPQFVSSDAGTHKILRKWRHWWHTHELAVGILMRFDPQRFGPPPGGKLEQAFPHVG